jgi:hypothetical protein
MTDVPDGPLVRPYAITRGRIASTAEDLSLVTLVVALREHLAADLAEREPEHEQILRLCRRPVSVAEVAARQPAADRGESAAVRSDRVQLRAVPSTAAHIDESIPVMLCDARQRASSKTVLVTLLEYLIERAMSAARN